VRVRGCHRSGSHPLSICDSKARRRVKLVGLTLLVVGVTLGVSWRAAGRMTGDPSVPQVQEGAPPA
jgi:hypothetical protein